MPSPKEVFDNPIHHKDYLTNPSDDHFEWQHFDRKEACQPDGQGIVSKSNLDRFIDEKLKRTISAFANSNREGGLLVLGISTNGEVKGIEHLNESQRNAITNFDNLLRNQTAHANIIDFEDSIGGFKKICLIYVPYTSNAICETLDGKAFIRQGSQSIGPIGDEQRDRIRREKGIVDFELSYCTPYSPNELDRSVLDEFRKVYLQDATLEYTDEELLLNAGAIRKDQNGNYYFTNSGYLFFSSNPQSQLAWARIRLLRFEVNSNQRENRGLPTFDKEFTGSITKQIRDIRNFFQGSAFFKTYQRRNPEGGGFIEEPEYPFDSYDEAIVNAVAHRDYALKVPIHFETYKDSILIQNPGKVQQLDRDVPKEFSLNDILLTSKPRNPKLIEWLKLMRTDKGIAFVRALSEGTRTMKREMDKLGLPAPLYKISDGYTNVFLFNNAEEREALLLGEGEIVTEFANLYPLSISFQDKTNIEDKRKTLQREVIASLKDSLVSKGWYLDTFKFGRIIAHRQGVKIPLSRDVEQIVRFYPAYIFQVRSYWGEFYLCIDYTLEVKNVTNLSELMETFSSSELNGKRATVNWNGWQSAKILESDSEWAQVYVFDYDVQIKLESKKIIPYLPSRMIEVLLEKNSVRFDLQQAKKRHSLSSEPSAARIRFEKTQTTAESITDSIFPLIYNGTRVRLKPNPSKIKRSGQIENNFRAFSLSEPNVEFGKGKVTEDIRDGIVSFGSYYQSSKEIEIVPICPIELKDSMVKLIDRLKNGQYKYKGSERTFHTRFTYNTIINCSIQETLQESKRLINEHYNWKGNAQNNRLFLIHTPEKGYSLDDENSPYFHLKRFFLQEGIPSQMIDTPTIQNPDWKDLNLALNIVSKCGIVPWVLPDEIPDADFFIGLSYTNDSQNTRLMGYANVFNQYGRWEFYSGNIKTFSFEERVKHFSSLVKETMARLSLSETPSIHFHYTKKFSREEREAIISAAKSVKPKGTYSLVSINKEHPVRLYDVRAETDGSFGRGSYIATSRKQFFLSTTGYNPYRKSLGTPQMLEVNVYVETPNKLSHEPDLRIYADHILKLTKLNWASTEALCGEPITTKFAGDIAKLNGAFLRQGTPLNLHSVLERTPWFL